MRNQEQRIFVGAAAAAGKSTVGVAAVAGGRRTRGVTGRLRPYRDVRAGFEPWRRLALAAWAAREDSLSVH